MTRGSASHTPKAVWGRAPLHFPHPCSPSHRCFTTLLPWNDGASIMASPARLPPAPVASCSLPPCFASSGTAQVTLMGACISAHECKFRAGAAAGEARGTEARRTQDSVYMCRRPGRKE